jgi:hypothetical protein
MQLFVTVRREMFDMIELSQGTPHSPKDYNMGNAGIGYPNF